MINENAFRDLSLDIGGELVNVSRDTNNSINVPRILSERKKLYLDSIYSKMVSLGLSQSDIPKVLALTKFEDAFNEYPEEIMLLPVENTVYNIVCEAAVNKKAAELKELLEEAVRG